MSDCPDNSALITYLYEEDAAGDRERVGSHVAACRACSEELASMRSVQGTLSVWTAPVADRAFDRWRDAPSAASTTAPDPRPSAAFWSGWSLSPAWSLGVAAAACLAVGVTAAAIAGFEVRYGDFAVSIGRPASPEETVAAFGGRDTDIVLSRPGDAFGSGLEFALVGGDPLPRGDTAAMLERLTIFTPESSTALLEEIRRRMAERELASEPAWPDIVQRLRSAQERNPERVREDFADFVVRVAAPPGDVRPAGPGR